MINSQCSHYISSIQETQKWIQLASCNTNQMDLYYKNTIVLDLIISFQNHQFMSIESRLRLLEH